MPTEAEADLIMQKAKEHHTKTLFKWSSDWDSAAVEYEKAAKIYTHIGIVDKAKKAWEAASHAQEKAKNLFSAAKDIEALANFLKDNESYIQTEKGAQEVVQLFVRAAKMYALDQKPERQSESLVKAARLVPPSDTAASKLVIQGLDALEDSGKYHLTLDLYRSLILSQVRGNAFLDAIVTLKREAKVFEKLNQPQNGAKAGLEIIVLCLCLGDWVLADREFRELNATFYGFAHSKEQCAAQSLMSALEAKDSELLNEAIKDSVFQFIIPDIGRRVKKFTVDIVNAPTKQKESPQCSRPTASGVEDEEDLR